MHKQIVIKLMVLFCTIFFFSVFSPVLAHETEPSLDYLDNMNEGGYARNPLEIEEIANVQKNLGIETTDVEVMLEANVEVVYTYTELKNALSQDNGIDTVYLGANIVMGGQILVHPNKTNIVIDGTYNGVRYRLTEVDSTSSTTMIYINHAGFEKFTLRNIDITGRNYHGLIHVVSRYSHDVVLWYENVDYVGPQITYSEYATAVYKDVSIHLQVNGVCPIGKVADISGVEFYGEVSITGDNAPNSGSFTYFRDGEMIFHEDSVVTVGTMTQAFLGGKGVNITFEKNATLNYSNDTPNFGFTKEKQLQELTLHEGAKMNLYYSHPSATVNEVFIVQQDVYIAKNAELNIVANRRANHMLVQGEGSDWIVDGGKISITGNTYLASILKVNTMHLKNGGQLYIDIAATVHKAIFVNLVTIEKGSSIDIRIDEITYSGIVFENTAMAYSLENKGSFTFVSGRISSSALSVVEAWNTIYIREDAEFRVECHGGNPRNALIYFSSSSNKAYLDVYRPKKLMLYSAEGRLLSYAKMNPYNPLYITAGLISYWSTDFVYSQSEGFGAYPELQWKKNNNEDFYITGLLQNGSWSANDLQNIQSNWDSSDKGVDPNGNFSIAKARAIVMGYISISLNPFTEDSTVLSGKTEPFTNIRLRYALENATEYISITADENGNFSYPVGKKAPGTIIYLEFSKDYLFATHKIHVGDENVARACSFDELDAMIADDNGIDTIILCDDITMESNITVPAVKTNITIDGTSGGKRYTISEESNNTGFILTNDGFESFTFRNLDLLTENVAGIIKITIDAYSEDVVIAFDNVNFSGPLVVDAVYGTVVFKDSSITITDNAVAATERISSAGNIEFYGVVNIDMETGENSLFKYLIRGNMILHENAIVLINEALSSLFEGEGTDVILYDNSVLNYFSISPDQNFANQISFKTLTLYENAKLNVSFTNETLTRVQTQSFRVVETVQMNNGSELNIANHRLSTTVVFGDDDWVIDGGKISITGDEATIAILRIMKSLTLLNGGELNVDYGEADFGLDIDQMMIGKNSIVDIYIDTINKSLLNLGHEATQELNAYSLDVEGSFKAKVNSIDENSDGFLIAMNSIYIRKDATFHLAYLSGSVRTALITKFSNVGIDSAFYFDEPKSVLLYSPESRLFAYRNTGTLYLRAKQINYSESLLDYPQQEVLGERLEQQWFRANGDSIYISGTLIAGIGEEADMTNVITNWHSLEGNSSSPSETLSVHRGRILAMGYINVDLPIYYEDSTILEGKTDPYTNIEIYLHTVEATESIQLVADKNGDFSFPLGILEEGTNIYVEFSRDFLSEMHLLVVADLGSLKINNIPSIEFEPGEVSSNLTSIASRQDKDWSIVITDTRPIKTNWKLYAKIVEHPYTIKNNVQYELDESIVFVDEFGNKTFLSTDYDTLIYYHKAEEEGAIIQWSEERGILFQYVPSNVFKDSIYRAVIEWTLVDAP